MERITVLVLSILLSILICLTSLTGFMTPDFYLSESSNWQAQTVGQDLINVFIILPFLLMSAFFVYKQNLNAIFLWAGAILYISYTYVIYCFNIHFNSFFPQYCIILGISVYTLFYIFYSNKTNYAPNNSNQWINKITAFYFLIISLLFYFLWISEIIPSVMSHSIPKAVTDAGLFTNPVHVLDLSILLPGVFITGVLLFKKNYLGYFLAPIILSFLVLMSITIAVLTLVMVAKGIGNNLSVAYLMVVLVILNVVLLSLNLKYNKSE